MRPTAAQVAASLGLQPHPEGGYYRETYRAPRTVRTAGGDRAALTAIVFLVTTASVSRLHRLASDELWMYQDGLPLELVTIAPGGVLERRVLCGLEDIVRSDDTAANMAAGPAAGRAKGSPSRPATEVLVPAGSWQGARVSGGPHLPADRAWTLVSCVVSPGFEFADFEIGDREALLAAFPGHADLIGELT